MLHFQPTPVGYETFSTRSTITLSTRDYYYYYYFHLGSQFTISACIRARNHNSSSATFYLLEGSQEFDKWEKNPQFEGYKHSFKIASSCSSRFDISNITYEVTAEDYYYLAFRNNGNVSIILEIELSVLNTHYKIKNRSSIIETCSNVSSWEHVSLCSVDVPLSSAIAYMTIQPNKDHGVRYWDSELYIHTTCMARYWMYAVISVAIAFAVTCALNFAMVCIYVTLCKNKKKKLRVFVETSSDPTTPLLSDSGSYHQQDKLSSYEGRHSVTPCYSPFPSYTDQWTSNSSFGQIIIHLPHWISLFKCFCWTLYFLSLIMKMMNFDFTTQSLWSQANYYRSGDTVTGIFPLYGVLTFSSPYIQLHCALGG